MESPAGDRSEEKKSRRRSARFPLTVPVEASWVNPSGSARADGQATEVNSHGGLLHLSAYPPVGETFAVTNCLSTETTQARVVNLRRSRQGGVTGAAIELMKPNDNFWGITYRLKKTSAELVELDQALRAGGMDLRVLMEFRDAVDYVRKTAWVVYEWQEREMQHRDTATVLPLLTAERIRRATQLCHAICSDMASHKVAYHTAEIAKFFQAVEKVYQQLTNTPAAVKPQ